MLPIMGTQNQRLQQARIKAGFSTASEAARVFGWNENTYRSHENGERGLKINVVERYAKALGVSISWIIVGQGNPDGESIVKISGFINRDGIVTADINPEEPQIIVPPAPIPNHYYCYIVNGDFLYPRYSLGDAIFISPPVPTNITDETVEGILWIEENSARFGFFHTSSFQKYHLEMQGIRPLFFDRIKRFGPVELVIRENRYHNPRYTKRA